MNSVPEILIGKPFKKWTRGDFWQIRALTSLAGLCFWVLLMVTIELLQPGFFLPWALILFIGGLYALVLLALTCKALPIPPDVVSHPAWFSPLVSKIASKPYRSVVLIFFVMAMATTFLLPLIFKAWARGHRFWEWFGPTFLLILVWGIGAGTAYYLNRPSIKHHFTKN